MQGTNDTVIKTWLDDKFGAQPKSAADAAAD